MAGNGDVMTMQQEAGRKCGLVSRPDLARGKGPVGRVIAVQGAAGVRDVPGLSGLEAEATLRFAHGAAELREAIRDAEILLGWDFRAKAVREAWPGARRLRWIHWEIGRAHV